MEIPITYDQIILPEQMYGIIKKIGYLNKEPILYGDPNLLKIGQLYYLNGGIDFPDHYDVYRLARIESNTYYFETAEFIEQKVATEIANDGFSISEQELNTVRKIGRIFNKPIYTGDVNLLDNGSYYYHKSFPLLTTVAKDDDDSVTIKWGPVFIKFKNLTIVNDADNEDNLNHTTDEGKENNGDDADFTIKP